MPDRADLVVDWYVRAYRAALPAVALATFGDSMPAGAHAHPQVQGRAHDLALRMVDAELGPGSAVALLAADHLDRGLTAAASQGSEFRRPDVDAALSAVSAALRAAGSDRAVR